jgi:hypothetical protein
MDLSGPQRSAVKIGEAVLLCGDHPLDGRQGVVEAKLANGDRYRIGINGMLSSRARCTARDTGTALVFPRANANAMQHHLKAISRCVAPGAHAVFTLDYPS